jgi:GcrA cell cycle regulator
VSDLSHKPVHKGNTVTGPSPFWAEHDAELRRYAEQGLTTKAAAEALGVTKNAVIGRARRVGIVWARQPMGGRAKRRIEMQQRSWNFPPPGMCVYPLGHPTEPGFHFCSMPVERGAYCGEHHAKCYIPASKTSAKSEEWSEERKIAQALRSRAQFNTREAA